jgi:hypothetical protein
MNKRPGERSVEPDPDERDEHAYEDTWYRALKAVSERRTKDEPPPDEVNPPEDD